MRAALFLLALLSAPAMGGHEVYRIASGIQYCVGGRNPLLMDVFLPAHPIRKPAPAILWLHGGGWERGDKNGSSGAELLAAEGFVTASIFYRLSGDSPFPANLEDCKCAVRYLRVHAALYGINPSRIGVAGASAGGHLAMLVATAHEDAGMEGNGGWAGTSSRVQAAASWYGPTDFTVGEKEFEHHTGRAVIKLFRGTLEEKPEEYRRASPVTHVDQSDPPLLLIQGEKDDIVPFDQAIRMKEKYEARGLTVEFIPVKNAGHDFHPAANQAISPSVDEIRHRTVEFFKRRLAH